MNRRFGLIYTIFSLLVLTVLIVLVLARLNTARAMNIDEAEASYARLRTELAQDTIPVDEMPDLLREYAALVGTVDALVLYSPDRGIRFAWSDDAQLIALSRSELSEFRGFPDYRLSEVSHYRLRNPIGASADGFYVDAVYSVLNFSDAYLPLRDSLISLLIFAFLTVLLVLALGRAGVSRPPAPEPTVEATVEPAHEAGVEAAPETSVEAAPETGVPHPTTAQPPTDDDERYAYEEIPLEELATDPGEPGTLFNPVTGLSHRGHLDRRLGLELQRSAYNDQDLTCIIIKFPGISSDDQRVEKAAQVLSTFQFEDLCFEHSDTSFCVILPNVELPQGLRQAESFRKRHPDALLGLSARNGRLVEADRVITEAERSLSHAAAEPGGIVGFRPDPRKYRQFVTQHIENE